MFAIIHLCIHSDITLFSPDRYSMMKRLFHLGIQKAIQHRNGKSLFWETRKIDWKNEWIAIKGTHSTQIVECTCVDSKAALIALNTPFSGTYQTTTKYVMPNNGISTSSAFDAFLYCRVSAVAADRNLMMSTLTIHF